MNEFTYVRLTEDTRFATGGSSEFYSQRFHDLSSEYHRNGKDWSDERLAEFFSEGLLKIMWLQPVALILISSQKVISR